MKTSVKKIAILYLHMKTSLHARSNFQFFTEAGTLTEYDYFFGLSKENLKKHRTKLKNWTIAELTETNTQLNLFNELLATALNIESYDNFIFLSSELRGPFHEKNGCLNWADKFVSTLNGETHLAGTKICVLPKTHPHAEIFNDGGTIQEVIPYVPLDAFVLTREALKFLIAKEIFGSPCSEIRDLQILSHDLPISAAILANGWNISCLIPEYKGVDYRTLDRDFNPSSHHGDPTFINSFFGKTLDKNQLLFSDRTFDNQKKNSNYKSSQRCRLFQITYDESTRLNLQDGFKELDNSHGPASMREVTPIHRYLSETEIREDEWVGFFSPKFFDKTKITAREVRDVIGNVEDSVDACLFSGHWHIASMYTNVWVQGEACHPGLMETSQQLAGAVGYNLNLQTAVTPLDKAVFNHFIVAKPSFWNEWRRVVAIYFDIISRDKSLFSKMVRYQASALPIHTFVIERIPTMILLAKQMNCHVETEFFTRQIALDSQLGNDLLLLDHYKHLFTKTCNGMWLEFFSYFLKHYCLKFDEINAGQKHLRGKNITQAS